MTKMFNKKVKARRFILGQLILKKIFSHQDEAKEKFAPNWHGAYIVYRVLSREAIIVADIDNTVSMKLINSGAIKKY